MAMPLKNLADGNVNKGKTRGAIMGMGSGLDF